MNDKTIIYIGGFELPDKNAAAQRVIANALAMKKLGFEVIFLGLSKNVKEGKFIVKGFECYEMEYPNSFIKWIYFLFSNKHENKLIDRLNVDSIILYNFPAFKFWSLLKRYGKIKQIYADVTEWYEARGFSLSAIIKRLDVWIRMKKLHLRVSGLIVISDFLENYYKKLHNNVISIPPLVDSFEEKWGVEESEREESRGINLVYAGSPGGGQKDRVDLIISAVKDLVTTENANIKLDIVGITQDEFYKKFNFHNIDSFDNIRECVFFHGRMSHLEALMLVKNADYSIFFRDNNLTNLAGFPTKFVEAITAGTPVITNFSSNLKDYFDKYPSIGVGVSSMESDEIKNVLRYAVNKTKLEISELKELCKELRIFDYNKYVDKFRIFFLSEEE